MASMDGSGRNAGGRVGRPSGRGPSTPATTRLSARSTISSSSRPGSLDDTGWGTAPSIQHASVVRTKLSSLGKAMVTRSPVVTPRSASARAVRFASSTSARHVIVGWPTTVSAGWSGWESAKPRNSDA